MEEACQNNGMKFNLGNKFTLIFTQQTFSSYSARCLARCGEGGGKKEGPYPEKPAGM